MTDGLKNKYRRAVIDILSTNERVDRVVLFGSRAMGTFTVTSDVDIALFGDMLTLSDQAELVAAIDELTMPQKIDVLLYRSIKSEKLLAHIKTYGVEWWRRSSGMGNNDSQDTFKSCVSINPKRKLPRGQESVYVAMKDLGEFKRRVSTFGRREFKGSGSRFSNGDTLLARITPCLENGKTAFVDFLEEGEIAHGSTEFIVLSAVKNSSDPLFVYYLARLPEFRSFAIARMEGSSGRQRVPASTLANFDFELPPLPVQRAIARVLGSLDDKIELNRQMNRSLERMAEALFKSWFIDFAPVHAKAEGRGTGLPKEIADRFPGSFEDSELGEIPKGWEVKPIGDAVQCVGGSTPSTKKAEFWDGGTNPFLTPKDMSSLIAPVILDTTRHITDAGVEKISSRMLPPGTVILSSRAPIGYLAISEVPMSVNQGIIAMICNGDLPNHYVLLWTMASMEIIKNKAGGTTFAEISKKNFRPIPALIPAPSILDAFTEHVEPLFQQVVENVVSVESLARARDTLLPKLISGELPITDVEKILEGVE